MFEIAERQDMARGAPWASLVKAIQLPLDGDDQMLSLIKAAF